MDMTKNPQEMTNLELSTALYHLSVNNYASKQFTLDDVSKLLAEASTRLTEPLTGSRGADARYGLSKTAIDPTDSPIQGDAWYTRKISFDSLTGKITEEEYETRVRNAANSVRKYNEDMNRKLNERIKRDWSKPEGFDDLYNSDPRERGDL